ncbi:putative inorganic phosphate cotransporter [Cloeon dipterum]|uniref:putative inorganic phosphate cotransporter n=1 Tax=Cloeon dipterum TaxID=197152 RepID=UPI00321F8A74
MTEKSEWCRRLGKACMPQRHVLAIMGLLAVVNAYTMRISLSVAIVSMIGNLGRGNGNSSAIVDRDPNSCPYPDIVEGEKIIEGEFDWDTETVGIILGSFYWGYIFTHLPGGILSEKWGGKYLLSVGILSTAIFTLVSPVAARYGGPSWFIAVRVLMGLGEGTTFPALNALLAQWIPVEERGFWGTLVFSGSQVGTIVGTALTGLLIEAWGWESVFYFYGGCAFIWFIVFTLICYSRPDEHPYITEEELEYLNEKLGDTVSKDIPPIPWKSVATSVPLWGLVVAQIGHDWGFFTLITDLPLYMKDVLHYKVGKNGLVSSLPYVAMWSVSLSSGLLADWLLKKKYLSTTNVRKIFTTVASVLPAVGLLVASYAGCNEIAVVTIFCVFIAFMGAFYPGMKVNALDLSPNYAGLLMAIVNGIGSLSGIVTPYVAGVIAKDHTAEQWRTVFWIVFAVMNLTNLVYVLTATGKVQPWNWGENGKDFNNDQIQRGNSKKAIEMETKA